MQRRPFLLGLLAVPALLTGCASAPPPTRRAAGHAALPQLSTEQAEDIAIHALGLVGTPYRWGGNTPESGFDCSGLIGYVYRSRAGLTPPRTVAQLADFGRAIESSLLRTGDLVIFGDRPPTHAGIYVGDGRFVHAPSRGGAVRMDRLASTHWSRQKLDVRRP